MKRSPLTRSGTGLVRRTKIASVSRKRAKQNKQREGVLRAKFGERPWPCAFWDYAPGSAWPWPSCYGRVDGHEIKSRAQGGSITDPDNIVPLCAVHNEFIASHRALGEAIGLRK
jgi:hypothetical protein